MAAVKGKMIAGLSKQVGDLRCIMIDTTDLIQKALNELCDNECSLIAGADYSLVPTLKIDIYQPISPMLSKRFQLISSWEEATHADWLSIEEMEALWEKKPITNPRIKDIKSSLNAHIQHWENNLGALVSPDKLSLFAGSAYTYEHIYLFWCDNIEPEIWVYDTNGETRFNNSNEYLMDCLGCAKPL